MKNLLVNRRLVPSLALAARHARRATPAAPAAPTQPVPLDAIVAVVGDQPITRFDLREARPREDSARRGQGADGQRVGARRSQHESLDDLIQDELLIQKAKDLKIEVADADVSHRRRSSGARDARASSERVGVPHRAREGVARHARGVSQVLMDQFRRQLTRAKGPQQAEAGRQDRSDQRDRRRDLGGVRDRRRSSFRRSRRRSRSSRSSSRRSRRPAAKEAARVEARSRCSCRDQGRRRFREDREARVDGSADEGNGRRSRLGTSRRERSRVRSLAVRQPLPRGACAGTTEPGLRDAVRLPHHPRRSRAAGRGEGASDPHRAEDRLARRRARRRSSPTASPTAVASGVAVRHAREEVPRLRGQRRDEHSDAVGARQSAGVVSEGVLLQRRRGDIVSFQIPGSSQRPDVPKFVVAQLLTADEGGERTLARCASPPCEAISRSAAAFAATSTRSRSRRSWRFDLDALTSKSGDATKPQNP